MSIDSIERFLISCCFPRLNSLSCPAIGLLLLFVSLLSSVDAYPFSFALLTSVDRCYMYCDSPSRLKTAIVDDQRLHVVDDSIYTYL